MFAANVFTIIDSQDMQERNRLGPVAVTPGGAQCKGSLIGFLPFTCSSVSGLEQHGGGRRPDHSAWMWHRPGPVLPGQHLLQRSQTHAASMPFDPVRVVPE